MSDILNVISTCLSFISKFPKRFIVVVVSEGLFLVCENDKENLCKIEAGGEIKERDQKNS